MKPFLFLLILLSGYLSSAQVLDQKSIYFKVHDAAKKAKAGDKAGLMALYKMSLQDHGDIELNKMMIKTIMLSMIKNKSKALRKYIPAVDIKFIGRGVLDFLDQVPLQVKCPKCGGDGVEEFQCRECFKGTCRNCNGKKKIGYKGLGREFIIKNCPTCKATGKCLSCEATGIGKKNCRTCWKKGTVFSKAAVPGEYVKSLDYIVNYLPKYAARKKIYITPQIVVALKRQELERELKKVEEEKARELAKLEAERRAKAAEIMALKKKAPVIKHDPANYDSRLEHPLLEFNQFCRVRERFLGYTLFEKSDAKYIEGKPTLTLDVSANLVKADANTRMQYLEGFYQFWKLRCTSNRVGSNVGYIVNYKGRKIAELKDGEVVMTI